MNPIEALKMHGVGVGKKLVGDAQPGDVRSGKTFSNVDGNDKQGTMPVRSLVAQTITPGVNNIIKQAGIYDGDITIEGDPDLVTANIVIGKSIFGVGGSVVTSKKASGTVSVPSGNSFTITGLDFKPTIISVKVDGASNDYTYVGFYSDKANTGTAFGINAARDNNTNYIQNPFTNVILGGFTFTAINFQFSTVKWEARE